jgi:hypothetical protein
MRDIKLLQAEHFDSAFGQMEAGGRAHRAHADDDHIKWVGHGASSYGRLKCRCNSYIYRCVPKLNGCSRDLYITSGNFSLHPASAIW